MSGIFSNPLRPLSGQAIGRVPTRQVIAPRCVRICAISVRGSRGTQARFRQDLARAQEVFSCANVILQEGGFLEVNDPTLLNINQWTVSNVPADALRLLAMGPACGRPILSAATRPVVYAYYVQGLGGGYNGIGRPNFANNAPGLVVSDAGGDYTFAHEIGHVLGLNPTTHDPDPANIMYYDSPNITSTPPQIRPDQCRLASSSTIPTPCPEFLPLPPAQTPRITRVPPFARTPALQGLLSDEPGVVERFAAMGQAILPQLLSQVANPDLAVRVRVAAVLARMGFPEATRAAAMALLNDPHPAVRATAAGELAAAGHPIAESLLTRALQDNDPGVRAAVLRALGQLRTPTSLREVGLATGREPHPLVRSLAGRLALTGA